MLFKEIAFSGRLYKVTMSVERIQVDMGQDYYQFKIGFFQELKGIQEKVVKRTQNLESLRIKHE